MKIDRIEPVDRRKSRVYLDGEFAFVLYNGELKRFHMDEGGEISDSQYQVILHEIIFKRAREKAVYWLKCSARTEAEIRRKLKESFYPDLAADYTVELLKKYRYIDDEEYARNYIELNGRKKSRAEIAAVLGRKGISRESVKRLLEENPIDEEEQAKAVLRKRRFDPESAQPEEISKQVAYLMRKGFSYETVRRAMKSMEDLQ